jgi:hypothetical protein
MSILQRFIALCLAAWSSIWLYFFHAPQPTPPPEVPAINQTITLERPASRTEGNLVRNFENFRKNSLDYSSKNLKFIKGPDSLYITLFDKTSRYIGYVKIALNNKVISIQCGQPTTEENKTLAQEAAEEVLALAFKLSGENIPSLTIEGTMHHGVVTDTRDNILSKQLIEWRFKQIPLDDLINQ